MKETEKKVKAKKKEKLTLHPMKFDEALTKLLSVKPDKVNKKERC
ncbi:MAG: hypothetical protein WC769_02365 [Thermodesulfovibrionales bacterium]